MSAARSPAASERLSACDIADWPGALIVVTNPVDLLTRLAADISGSARVYGVGSALDSARYRHLVAAHLALPATTVDGQVLGEHGDGAVLCASTTHAAGRPADLDDTALAQIRTALAARPGLISAGIGRVRCAPAAAAVSAAAYELVRQRLLDGAAMHPTQHPDVTAALLAGDRTILRKGNGHERKPQFFPDQLHDWLGLPLATRGYAAAILFAHTRPGAGAASLDEARTLGANDFLTSETEDRYPDVFGLAAVATADTIELQRRLGALPHHTVQLGHDTTLNSRFLNTLA